MASIPETFADEPPIRIVVVGHVDHGKSTLIGRLLNDVGALADGKVAAVAESSTRRGMPFEWAFVTDALRAERDQGITIDVSHIWFRTAVRPYLLLDAPGHREFLRNMVTGAAASDGGLLVIDALEGLKEQSRRHAFLLQLLGLRQIAVAISKMDLVGYAEARFREVADEVAQFFALAGVEPAAIVPVAAREGGNLATRSAEMAWYEGPTVIEALDRFATMQPSETAPLRLPVQDVYKFDERRIVAGRIESGRLRVGDTVLFSPSNRTAVVAGLEQWGPQARRADAVAGESIGVTLDPPIFIERGEIASHEAAAPMLSAVVHARLFWLGRHPMAIGDRYRLKLGTQETLVEVEAIEQIIDSASLDALQSDAEPRARTVPQDAVAEVVMRARGLLALDSHAQLAATGRFVLLDGYEVVGGGLVEMAGYPDQRKLIAQKSGNLTAVSGRITHAMHQARNGHRGGVLWFTGLSGAGKSTLAIAVEHRLFLRGYQIYVLDGDNIRRGLNMNLGFSPDDRAENIRRVGEVAALFADAGMIVLSAFISPYRSDRDRAREAVQNLLGADNAAGFHEVYIKADLAACETRDPKGLYRRARAGEIREFTGISAPYEPPSQAELVVDTEHQTIEECVGAILAYVETHFPVRAR
jgi:bifunctional enzyme CysN/CysC